MYIPQYDGAGGEGFCDILFITYTGHTFRISAETFKRLIEAHYSGAYMMGIEGELELVNGRYRVALSKLTVIGEYDRLLDVFPAAA